MAKMVTRDHDDLDDSGEDWEGFIDVCDGMLFNEEYAFASDTIQGIRDWVEANHHVTPKQRQAISNIRESVGGEDDEEDW